MTFSLEVLATPEGVAWASCKLREDLAVKGEIVARAGVQRIFEVAAMLNQRKAGRQLSAEKLAQQYKKHLKDMATDSEEVTDHFIKECISLRGGILSQARIRQQVAGVSKFHGVGKSARFLGGPFLRHGVGTPMKTRSGLPYDYSRRSPPY